MSDDVVVVGGGGHGRELLWTLRAINDAAPRWRVLGVVDDGPVALDRLDRLGVPLLGDVDWLAANPRAFVLGVGDPKARTRLAERLLAAGCEPATVVHPRAELGPDVAVGDGVVVFDRCTITTNVAIGDHTHLNVGCAVQHDSVVGAFVQLSPGVLVNGDCAIGDGVFLGTGAIVTRGCRIGAGATVGAGAVVLHDVEPGRTVVGVPAGETR